MLIKKMEIFYKSVVGCLVGAALLGSALAGGRIEAGLSFSTDNGRTFSDETPVLAQAGEVLVRVDWIIKDETRPITDNVIFTSLWSEQGDFASANTGLRPLKDKKVWRQQAVPKHYFNASRDQSVVYRLNLGARAEGVMGHKNFSTDNSHWEDAPLPEVGARGSGVHDFVFHLYYRTADGADPVAVTVPFQVKINGAASAPPQSAPPAGEKPDVPVVPTVGGEKEWPATQWKSVGGSALSAPQDGLLQVKDSHQEAALALDHFVAGKFYLRLLVESGRTHGQEELYRRIPFVFLNGIPVPFSHAGPLVRRGNKFLTVIESSQPVAVKPGDVLRWNRERPGRAFGAVALATQPLSPAPVDVSTFFDPDLHDTFRVTAQMTLDKPSSGEAAPVSGQLTGELVNTSGHKADFQITLQVLDYWQKILAEETRTVSLEERASFPLALPFSGTGESDRYRGILTVRGPQGTERVRVCEELVSNPQGARPRLWLNQDWEVAVVPDQGVTQTRQLGLPEDAEKLTGWKRVNLPYSWQDPASRDFPPNAHLAWYRKTFELPSWLQGHRLFLRFTRVAHEARIFVNGKEAGGHFGLNGPFEVEITRTAQPGKNTILMGVRDEIATLETSELKAPKLEVTSLSRFRAPHRLRAGVGEVWLYGAGSHPLKDVFVQTSFQNKTVTVDIEPPADLPAGKAIISNRILDRGQEVLRLPDIELSEGSSKTVQTSAPWKDPILWNPGDPRLLQLVTELKTPEGTLLDRLDTRFGFREFRTEGRSLIWNDLPVKMSAVPFLSSWSSFGLNTNSRREAIRDTLLLTRRMGVPMQRHIYDGEYRAEMNDEEGIIFAQGTGGPSHATRQMIESDEFWNNAGRFAQELIRGLRNHPSIVTWYLSNEFMAASEPQNLQRLQQLGRAAQEADTTRILEFGCDLDLGGFSQVISTHYPVDISALRDEKAVFPEGAYWRRWAHPLEPGDKVPSGIVRRVANVKADSPITWGNKPIVVNETLWISFFLPPDGLTRLLGDRPYASPLAIEEAHKEASRWFIRGHRDAEASVITPWFHVSRDAIRQTLPEIDINPLQRFSRAYGGEKLVFDVNLHHDIPRKSSMQFAWKLMDQDKAVREQSQSLELAPAEIQRKKITLRLPKVKSRTSMELEFVLRENGKTVSRVAWPFEVYSREAPAFPENVRMGLYDPSGVTREALREFKGSAPTMVEALESAALSGLDALIIGEGAAQTANEAGKNHLEDFVRAGGNLLVLAQNAPPQLLPVALPVTSLVASRLWSFRPHDPLLSGLDPEEFSGWWPSEVLASSLYLKPEIGGWKTLLESGGPKGMSYSALLESRLGRGRIILSQLELIKHLKQSPVAARLWKNLLTELGKKSSPEARVGFWGSEESAFGKMLRDLSARLIPVGASRLSQVDALILEASSALSDADLEAIHHFVQKGGRLILEGVSPESRALASKICGIPVKVFGNIPVSWGGRAIRQAGSRFSEGLTNHDFFWKRRPDTEDYSETFFKEQSTIAHLGKWTLDAPGGEALLYPAFWVRIPVGEGEVLLSSLSWSGQAPTVKPLRQRIASALLTNLGVQLDPPQEAKLPENLSYQPLDISRLINRTFADEEADDGKGGWTDQGPDNDLRTFPYPKGRHEFAGVPFEIFGGAIVLASPHRPDGPPKAVELPVRGLAGVLFFLQTSAWTSADHHASYVVHYQDGSKQEIKLVGGVNLRDWAAPNAAELFSGETGTLTRLAWSGPGKAFPSVNLYLMAWPNPHPDKEITSVTFQSMGKGIPILVGVTIGQKGAATAPSQKQDPAQAKQLLAQGRAFLKEGKPEAALQAFQSALQADSHLSDAALELANLHVLRQEWPKAIAVYEAFLRTQPEDLEVFARLGKLLEQHGRLEEAEKVFRQSLEVNPNQPEIYQALQGLNQKRSSK